MKQNHINYQFITQMMIQSKAAFNITNNEYHNWIKSKCMIEWNKVNVAYISYFYLHNIYSCC